MATKPKIAGALEPPTPFDHERLESVVVAVNMLDGLVKSQAAQITALESAVAALRREIAENGD
jgi:hypothetical protein